MSHVIQTCKLAKYPHAASGESRAGVESHDIPSYARNAYPTSTYTQRASFQVRHLRRPTQRGGGGGSGGGGGGGAVVVCDGGAVRRVLAPDFSAALPRPPRRWHTRAHTPPRDSSARARAHAGSPPRIGGVRMPWTAAHLRENTPRLRVRLGRGPSFNSPHQLCRR